MVQWLSDKHWGGYTGPATRFGTGNIVLGSDLSQKQTTEFESSPVLFVVF